MRPLQPRLALQIYLHRTHARITIMVLIEIHGYFTEFRGDKED